MITCLLTCCACWLFSDALLTPIFDAKRLDSGGGRVRLKLLGDSLWVAGTGSREAEIEPYTTMNISFDPPTLTLTCAETDATKRFEIGAADGQRMVAELDDRIQLARHVSAPSFAPQYSHLTMCVAVLSVVVMC